MPQGMPDLNDPAMQEMMKNKDMIEAAQKMMSGGSSADVASNASVQEMMKNPDMIEAAMKMINSNPEMLKKVQESIPGGQNMTPEDL